MSKHKRIEDYEATLPSELDELWQRWRNGGLAQHTAQLKEFAGRQRAAIQADAGGVNDPPVLISALKRRVVELGTVHHRSEMRDQMSEIQKHLWYQGEKGDHDRDRAVQDWATCHASNWRRWRLKEYLFVIDRITKELSSLWQ